MVLLMEAIEEYLNTYEQLMEASVPRYRVAFETAIAQYLKDVNTNMANQLRAGRLSMDDIRRTEQAIRDCFDKGKAGVVDAYTDFTMKAAEIGRNKAIKDFKLGLDFNMINEYAEAQLRKHAFDASERTISRMIGDVMGTLQKCHRDGLSIYEIRQELNQDFQDMTSWQLDRISRTELHSASQKGGSLAYSHAGVGYVEWVTAQDDRVRGTPGGKWENVESDHSEMHGYIVRTRELFTHPTEGWRAEYPGDRNFGAPISAWIQCRCQLVPFWMPKGKAAPESMKQFRREDLMDVVTPEQLGLVGPSARYVTEYKKLKDLSTNQRRDFTVVYDKQRDITMVAPKDSNIANQLYTLADLQSDLDILPDSLTKNVKKITLSDGSAPHNAEVALRIGTPNFRSAATAYGDDIVFWGENQSRWHSYETLVHELAHTIDKRAITSSSETYKKAIAADKAIHGQEWITPYAQKVGEAIIKSGVDIAATFSEDFADSVAYFMTHKARFIENYPNRAKFLEERLR